MSHNNYFQDKICLQVERKTNKKQQITIDQSDKRKYLPKKKNVTKHKINTMEHEWFPQPIPLIQGNQGNQSSPKTRP